MARKTWSMNVCWLLSGVVLVVFGTQRRTTAVLYVAARCRPARFFEVACTLLSPYWHCSELVPASCASLLRTSECHVMTWSLYRQRLLWSFSVASSGVFHGGAQGENRQDLVDGDDGLLTSVSSLPRGCLSFQGCTRGAKRTDRVKVKSEDV